MQPSFIDTHCHLDIIIKGFEAHAEQRLTKPELTNIQPIIERAAACGVQTIITVGTTLNDSRDCITIAQQYPTVYAAIGLHPTNLTASWHNDFAHIEQLLTNTQETRIVAIGETGIDLYHPGDFRKYQEESFRAHIQLAIKYRLPLIIHSREAAQQTMDILNDYANHGMHGIMHCFAYNHAIAQQAIDLGLHLGISCTITRPNNQLHTFIKDIDLAHVVLETDAPFLPPQQLRGTANVPANIPYAAHALAECIGQPLETVARITTANARALFKI